MHIPTIKGWCGTDVVKYPSFVVGIISKESGAASFQRANARIVSASLSPYGGITYFINSFDYPNLLFHYYVIVPYKVKRRRKIRGDNAL